MSNSPNISFSSQTFTLLITPFLSSVSPTCSDTGPLDRESSTALDELAFSIEA